MKSRDGIHGSALQDTISTGMMTNVLFTMPHGVSTQTERPGDIASLWCCDQKENIMFGG
jgi:hypothetical protein